LRPCSDQPVVSLAVYKARKRRALAAKADASRRALIATALCMFGIFTAVVVTERDAQLPAVHASEA
jgi:hypothetical protein